MVRGIILTFCMFRGDNARQRVTPLPRTWKGRKMCFTLPHIQKLKNDFSMELTIIETSAYQELRRLVSTLAVQMDDLQKRLLRLHRTNEWMHRTCAWLWAYRNGACKTTGITDLCLTRT